MVLRRGDTKIEIGKKKGEKVMIIDKKITKNWFLLFFFLPNQQNLAEFFFFPFFVYLTS